MTLFTVLTRFRTNNLKGLGATLTLDPVTDTDLRDDGIELSLGDDHTFCDTYLVHGAANTWQHHLAGNHPVGEVLIDAS
jgi:hypothetical protein